MKNGTRGRTEFNPKNGIFGERAEKMLGDLTSRVHYIGKTAALRG